MKNVLGLLGAGSRGGGSPTSATATTHTGAGVAPAASDAGNNGITSSASHFEVEAKTGDLSPGSATLSYLSENDAGSPLVLLGTDSGAGTMQQHLTGSSHFDKASLKGHSSRDSIHSASGDEGRLFSTMGSEFRPVDKKNTAGDGGGGALVVASSAGRSHAGASASLLSTSSASEGTDAKHNDDEIYGTNLGAKVCPFPYFPS